MFGMLDRLLEIIRRWVEELLAGYSPELILNGSFEEDGGAGHEFQTTARASRCSYQTTRGSGAGRSIVQQPADRLGLD